MLAKGAVAALLTRAEELRTDILYFGGKTVYETPQLEESHPRFKDVYRRKTGSTEVMTGYEMLALMQEAKDYKPSCVMQIYSSEFIENGGFRFAEGIIHEDQLFSFVTLLSAKRTAVLTEPLYIRRIREGSIMTRARSFDNVYGYYVAMKEMLGEIDDAESERRLSEEEYLAAFAVVRKMCNLAAKMYGIVGEEGVKSGLAGVSSFDRASIDLIVRTTWRNKALSERKEQLKEKISEQRELITELKKYDRELERLKKSASYRLGRALTALPRKIRAAFKRN
jgi:hypothetical protein